MVTRYCLLTPWSRVLLEKLTGFQLIKKFPVFYGTRRFITAFTNARVTRYYCDKNQGGWVTVNVARIRGVRTQKILVLQATEIETASNTGHTSGSNNNIDLREVGWEDSGLFLASGIGNSFGLTWTS